MCFIKFFNYCTCTPTSGSFDSFTIEPKRRTPVDSFGYKTKCCRCIHLKPAAIVIGIVFLFWAILQMVSADKVISSMIPDKQSLAFYYSKFAYMLIATGLLLAAGALFLGIIMNNFDIINVFVWYAFIFNCIAIVLNIIAFVLKILKTEEKIMRPVIRVILLLTWNFLIFYFLVIVNSYKLWWCSDILVAKRYRTMLFVLKHKMFRHIHKIVMALYLCSFLILFIHFNR